MTGTTRRLAEWVRGLEYGDLPLEVCERTKDLILDQLGCELACADLPWSRIVSGHVERMCAQGRCTVVRFGIKTNPEYAALANGTFGHGFEIDDYHIPALSHPGCVAVPAALSVAEQVGLDGRAVLLAVAIASEIIVRMGLAAGASLVMERGFHETCVEGTIGAAAGLGRVLDLDADRIVNAVSIAGSHSSGTIEYGQSGGDVKRLHAGLGAMGGVRAVLLAQAGLTGPGTILEGRRGIFQAFANQYDLARMTDDLGRVYELMGVCFKPYACVGLIHPQIDAVGRLVRQHGVTAGDVEVIEVAADRFTLSHVGTVGPEPRDITAAQCSAHFGLGMTVAWGANDFRAYLEAWRTDFRDPAVLEVARRVRLYLDEEVDRAFPRRNATKVTIRTRDGRCLDERVEAARGTARDPLSRDEIVAKFMSLATTILPSGVVDHVVQTVMSLETQPDVSRLVALLVA